MRIAFGLGLVGASLLMAGCSLFHHKSAAAPNSAPPVAIRQSPSASGRQPASPASSTTPVIKPDLRSWGQVVKVNAEARFVILAFEAGTVPAAGQRLNVYRSGVKVGEVTVTGPQQENNTVADIITGDIQAHDEARAD